MRFIFVTFQGILKKSPNGMAKLFYPYASEISNNFPVTYYTGEGENRNENGLSIKVVKYFPEARKIIGILDRLILRRRFLGYKRYLLEWIFDQLFSRYIKEPTFIVSGAYLPKTFKHNTNLGGENLFIAGNPSDNAIFNCMVREAKKYNIKFSDPYTNKRRLTNINKMFEYTDQLIIFTQSQFDTFSKEYPLDNIFYKETFIQPSPQNFPEVKIDKNKDFTFCYIAHTVWLKGLTYLIDAWVMAGISNAKLKIGGSIDKVVFEFIKNTYPELKGVEFIGHIDDLNRFYRESHVCVVPSLLDAGPTTISEAILCGIAVICTDGCGSKALINKSNGIIVKAGCSEMLSKSLIDMYKRKDELESNKILIQNSLALNCNDHSDEVIIKFLQKKYNQFIGEN